MLYKYIFYGSKTLDAHQKNMATESPKGIRRSRDCNYANLVGQYNSTAKKVIKGRQSQVHVSAATLVDVDWLGLCFIKLYIFKL